MAELNKATENYIPFCPVWELTLRCNLNCYHCGSNAGKQRLDELTTKEAIDLCKQLANIGSRGIALMGGEIFLRKDWKMISKEIKENGMKLSIITNGCINPSKVIPYLVKIEVDSLSVGLDAATPTLHDMMRGRKGAFNDTIRFLEEAKKFNLSPSVITTVSKLNYLDLPNMEKFVIENDYEWQIQMAVPTGKFPKELALNYTMYYALGVYIMNIQKKYGKHRIVGTHNLGFHSRYIPNLSGFPEWQHCYVGYNNLGIESNGSVKGCLPLPDSIEGNIRKSTLREIWENSNSFSYNRKFNPEKDLGGFCKTCKYGKICRGGCNWKSLAFTGSFHQDPFCFYRIEKTIFKDRIKEKIEEIYNFPLFEESDNI